MTPEDDNRLFDVAARVTAPLMLFAIAGWYTYLDYYRGYAHWKGANFSMFATLGPPNARFPNCTVLRGDDGGPVECPEAARGSIRDALNHTHDWRLQRAAHRVLEELRRERAGDDGDDIRGVEFEAWEYRYTQSPPELVARKLGEASVRVESTDEGTTTAPDGREDDDG